MITLFVVHAAVTLALSGLILTIQIVNYPLFEKVGSESFEAYHRAHLKFITRIVAPLMLVEIATAGALVFLGERSPLFLVSLSGIAVVWLSTAALQIPLHNRLALGFDNLVIGKLVSTNWLRTLAWLFRGICLAVLVHTRLAPH